MYESSSFILFNLINPFEMQYKNLLISSSI